LIEGETYDQFSPTPNAFQQTFLPTMAKHALVIQPRYQNMEGVNGKHRKMCAITMQFVIGGNKVYSFFKQNSKLRLQEHVVG